MKHSNYTRQLASWALMLLVALLAVPIGAQAQKVSFKEDFNYPAGDLYGQGGWMRFGTQAADPIQVVDKALAYAGYNDGAPEKCVKLGATKSAEDLMARFCDDADGIKEGSIYYSALINVETQPKGNCYVMGLIQRTKASEIKDGLSSTELGRLFIGEGTNSDEVKVGIERGGAKPQFFATPLKLGQTYLVVVRYQINEVTPKSDLVYLYVNPVDFKNEPATPDAYIDVNHTGSGLNYGLQGIQLRQATNASSTAPEMYIGSVRVADTYAGLFSSAEDNTPKISVSQKSFALGPVYAGDEHEETVSVTGENLTGDVSVESSSAAVTVSPATLSAADVMSAEGAKLNIKVNYSEGEQNAVVTLKSEGAADQKINVSWTGTAITEVKTIKELYTKNTESGEAFRYSGEAVISFIDKGAEKPVYYLQDATGAIGLSDDYSALTKTDYNAGDKLTGTILGIQSSFGSISAVAYNTNLGRVVSTGNAVAPKLVTLAELKAAPADYMQQLVMVKDLKFKDVAEGATFAEDMEQPVVTDGSDEAKVRIFKGTSLIGKNIPAGDITLIGLFTSKNMIIGPRGIEDIVEQQPQGEPTIAFSPEKIERKAGVVGKTVEVATLHVSAKNMTKATFFELAGKNADQFSISQSKIEKGDTETDIVISYTPTEVAVHQAYIMVNCPSINDYYKTINFSAYAIDEQNPPTIALSPTSLNKFTAKVGETSEQTIEVTTANMPDYAYVKVKDAGQFVLSNTMLMRNTKNSVTVTFKPTVAGTYNTALVFSALGMDDVEVPVEGVATGETPDEPKEGVDFVLSDENPLTSLNEKFDNITRNKPLDLDRWTNSALEGTRAWWGYSFLDYDTESPNENVAKVTAYDSKTESGKGTPAQMILVTPPLDFKNAKSKVFTFKVRGDYLQDNQTDVLELCYIDIAEGKPYILPLEECKMPCTKDESGKWFPYTVDLTGQQVADVFFMGFRFTGTRGKDNSATYYIDDVTYGLGTDGISTVNNAAEGNTVVYDLSGNRIAAASSAADALKKLSAGTYIIKTVSATGSDTKKVIVK